MREPEPPGIVGRPHQVAVAPDDERIEITTPSGSHKLYERGELAGHKELAFADTAEVGIYHVSAAAAGGPLQPRPALDFAVNLDPKESDFTKAKIGGESHEPTVAAADAPTRRIELWHSVAVALLAFLLLEGILTRR